MLANLDAESRAEWESVKSVLADTYGFDIDEMPLPWNT